MLQGVRELFKFEEEIKEQPEALQRLLDNIPKMSKDFSKIAKGNFSKIAFFGMGSSLYSTIPAVYLLRSFGIDAEYHDASEALWYFSKRWFNNVDVCVFVSQSGETVEIRELLDKLNDVSTIKLGITANVESYLGNNSDIVVNILSGEERAVGSTKTHMNSVLTSVIFSLVLSNSLEKELKNLQKLPPILDSCLLKASNDVENFLNKYPYKQIDASIITSRGYALGEVYQSALTLNEIARLEVFPISAGMLRHGPMELFAEKKGVTCFVPDSKTKPLLTKLCHQIANQTDFTWILSNSPIKIENTGTIINDVINSDLPEYLQSLLFLPYAQLLACKVRKRKKIENDEFRFISKVTTEE